MDGKYRDAIAEASEVLMEAMLEDDDELVAQGRQLDAKVRNVVFRLGLLLVRKLYTALQQRLIDQGKEQGFTVERRPVVTFNTVFGPAEFESVYLYDRQRKEGRRPLKKVFGVVGDGYSDAVERALTDFGIEKSFGRAAEQFEEHYGWEVGRTTILRKTEQLGEEAETFLEERFGQGEARYNQPNAKAPKAERMITSLDGCMLRTGKLMSARQAALAAENDDEREYYEELPADKTVRLEKWKEVRTGLARRPGQVDPVFVCRRGDYETICRQLFGAAGLQKLGFDTEVVGLVDGAFGLREAMELSFANLQIILDPSHLKHHFYETAEALGLGDEAAKRWVDDYFNKLADGHALKVVAELESECGEQPEDSAGFERLERLIGYLTRFVHCVHYREYKDDDWPIGSGEAEAAHRYIPQERLKISGACWREETLNPMLALRVVRANGWWDEFWESELERRVA